MEPTRTSLKKILDQEPDLTPNGMDSLQGAARIIYRERRYGRMPRKERLNVWKDAEKKVIEDRERMLVSDFKMFKICVKWLSQMKKIKTPTLSSYGLKHAVEALEGEYVHNGALIAAAIHLGIPIKHYEGPNVGVAISKRCPVLKSSGRYL